jgi:hypothetical protein
MNDPILLLFAVVNVIVTALFAVVVARQYLKRRRSYQLYWSLGLAMAFIGTLAYVFMILLGPTSSAGVLLFRLYYVLGAALTSAWLGLGSVALLGKRRLTLGSLIVLCVLSLLAIFSIGTASVNSSVLSHVAGTSGRGVLELGVGVTWIILLNTLGVVGVVGVAVYSGWKLLRRQRMIGNLPTSNLLWANVLILIGDLFNAAAGTFARVLGVDSTFWLFMAFGWIIFFAGVLLTGRRSTRLKQAEQSSVSREIKEQPVS